jgi:hypothetical protein
MRLAYLFLRCACIALIFGFSLDIFITYQSLKDTVFGTTLLETLLNKQNVITDLSMIGLGYIISYALALIKKAYHILQVMDEYDAA